MPAYTHFRAAMPISYGYYLLGVAAAAGREIDALAVASGGLAASPLGASAVAGTDLPIDPARTARLLGFATTARHAMDAVASRDVPLRVLASAAGLAIVLSRLASDFQLWSTAEFGFIGFPDRLVGGSSAMPQKRNAFLLEHVKAKPGHAAGAWAAAASMMTAAPFTNSIEVGTEAMAAIWPGLDAARQSVLLTQVLVSGARPVPARMRQRAQESFTGATSLANRLVRHGVPFRTAHHLVGEAVRKAVAAGSTDLAGFGPPGWLDGVDLSGLELAELVDAHRYGGGPGDFAAAFSEAADRWAAHRGWLGGWQRASRDSGAALAAAAEQLKTKVTA
jgi:argininosuccinate lyase